MIGSFFGWQGVDEIDVALIAVREAATEFVFADRAKHDPRILQCGRENANHVRLKQAERRDGSLAAIAQKQLPCAGEEAQKEEKRIAFFSAWLKPACGRQAMP